MTLEEMRAMFYDLTHDVERTGRTPDEVDRLINMEYRDFARRTALVESSREIDLVAGDSSFRLLEDELARPMPALWSEWGQQLTPVAAREISPTPSSGEPEAYAIAGLMVRLDAAVTRPTRLQLVRAVMPPPLVEDDDVPAVDRDWHDAIVWSAVDTALVTDGQVEEAAVWRGRAAEVYRAAEATAIARRGWHRRRGEDE